MNEKPSITVCVMGQMKSGKSTLINAMLGKCVAETKIQRATLCQSTIRLASCKSRDNTAKIRMMIENMNKTMKEQNKLEEVTELDCKIHSPLFQGLIEGIKSPVNIIDTIGYNEDTELGNDEINYKKLKENVPYTDVYIIPTKPDALLQQGDEKKTFRTLLKYIKELKVKPELFFLVNKKDSFEDEESIMAECKENVRKELKTAGLLDTVNCGIFPVSARYIGMHRIFLENNTIEDFNDKKQIGLFANYVLGKRKANEYMTDIHLKPNIKRLNDLLLEELKGSDWEKYTGFLELKTKVFDAIRISEETVILKGYQNAIRDHFTDYESKDNSSILDEILAKIRFTNRYKKSKHWKEIISEFKTEFMQLTNQLNEMELDSREGGLKSALTRMGTIFDFVNKKNSWFITNEFWKTLQQKVSSSIRVNSTEPDVLERIIELNNNALFDVIDSEKNKTFSYLFTTFFKKLLLPNALEYPRVKTCKTLQYELKRMDVTDSTELCTGDLVHLDNHRGYHRLEIKSKNILESATNEKYTQYKNNWNSHRQDKYTYTDTTYELKKGEPKYYINNKSISRYNIRSVLKPELVRTYETGFKHDSKEAKRFREYYDVIIKNNYTNLLYDDKKSVLEAYLVYKEKVFYGHKDYTYQVQKLVNTNIENKPILYDYLESVMHFTISREERIQLKSSHHKLTDIEELYCTFMKTN